MKWWDYCLVVFDIETKDQRPKTQQQRAPLSIGSNEKVEATKVKIFRWIEMQVVLATQLTPPPRQACLAKASCNWSTCSNLLGVCRALHSAETVWRALHSAPPTVSEERKTSIIPVIPDHFQTSEERKTLMETHLPEPTIAQIHFVHLLECGSWKTNSWVEFATSTCVAGAGFGPWHFAFEKHLDNNLGVTSVWNLFKTPQTKDQRPATS